MILALAVSDSIRDQNCLIAGGGDYMISAYSLSSSGCHMMWKEANAHTTIITAMCVGHGQSAKYVYSGDQQGKIYVWEILTGERIGELTSHSARITAMDVSADGQYVGNACFGISNSFAPLRLTRRCICGILRISTNASSSLSERKNADRSAFRDKRLYVAILREQFVYGILGHS